MVRSLAVATVIIERCEAIQIFEGLRRHRTSQHQAETHPMIRQSVWRGYGASALASAKMALLRAPAGCKVVP